MMARAIGKRVREKKTSDARLLRALSGRVTRGVRGGNHVSRHDTFCASRINENEHSSDMLVGVGAGRKVFDVHCSSSLYI